MTAPLRVARLPPGRRRRLGLVVLAALFGLVLLLSNLVPLAAEWLWFQALGYERVFATRLVAQAICGQWIVRAARADWCSNEPYCKPCFRVLQALVPTRSPAEVDF